MLNFVEKLICAVAIVCFVVAAAFAVMVMSWFYEAAIDNGVLCNHHYHTVAEFRGHTPSGRARMRFFSGGGASF
jgi:hypothetical protein